LKNLNFIECTLRDGGYHNSWDFDRALVEDYLNVCKSLEIKNIELGFRFPNSNDWLGEFAFTRESTLESLNLKKEFNIGVMINATDFINHDQLNFDITDKTFPIDATDSSLNFIRIATHIKDLDYSVQLAQYLIEKGYKLAINIMQAHNLDEEVVSKFSNLTQDLNLLSIYFADSLGCMLPNQINKLVNIFKNKTNIPIGIHAHNNMGLALANTIEAVNAGVNWVDMTMTGMGRGPGNTLTEDAMLYFLKPKTQNKIDLISLLEKHFYPLKEKHKWGSSPYYFLAGVNKVHPSYIQDLTKDLDFDVSDKVALIDSLGSIKFENFQNSESYNPDFREQYFNYYSLDNKKDNLNLDKLKNRDFLILGAGHTLDKYKEEIEKFIKYFNPTVLQLNSHYKILEELIDYRVSCHPQRLSYSKNIKNNIETPFIVPNLSRDISVDYPHTLYYDIELNQGKFLSKENYCILPNALAITYAIAIASKNKKIKNIYLAGIDGYDNFNNKNNELNLTFEVIKKNINCNILSITPTALNLDIKSLFSFEL
jgi:4-hydroxy 2-oxovalerate aldolase